jgi:hypothetical protein
MGAVFRVLTPLSTVVLRELLHEPCFVTRIIHCAAYGSTLSLLSLSITALIPLC